MFNKWLTDKRSYSKHVTHIFLPTCRVCAYDNVLLRNAVNDFKCPADVQTALTTGNESFCLKLEKYEEDLNILMNNSNLTSFTNFTNPFGFRLNMSCCPNNPVLQEIFLIGLNQDRKDWGDVKPGCIVGIPGITDTSSIAGEWFVCVCGGVFTCVEQTAELVLA